MLAHHPYAQLHHWQEQQRRPLAAGVVLLGAVWAMAACPAESNSPRLNVAMEAARVSKDGLVVLFASVLQ